MDQVREVLSMALPIDPDNTQAVIKSQFQWLQKLQSLNHRKPIRIKILEGKVPPGEDPDRYMWLPFVNVWHKITQPIYTRGILPNELLFDPDTPEWAVMKEGIDKLCSYCMENNIPFIMGFSGGKGVHVSIFFGNISLEQNLIDEINKTDIDVYKTVRKALVKVLAEKAGVDLESIRIDWGKINFNAESKGSQVRDFGTIRTQGLYKTMIERIPAHKPDPYELPLIFPEKVELWEIENTEFKDIAINALKAEVERAKKANEHNLVDVDFSGTEIMSFPCIKKLHEIGVTNGRYYAGEGMFLLCKKCGISKETAEQYVRNLFKTFPGITQAEIDLRIRNASTIYETDKNFSCNVLKEHFLNHNLCDFSKCPIKEKLEEKNKDDIEEITLEDLKKLKIDLNDRRLPNLADILPQDHFINKVTRWMSGLSDTYYEYQVLAALWLLSDLIQGKGSLRLRTGTVKPNLYVTLLGQSTKSRKTTAVKKIKQIRESATDTEFYNDEPTIEGYLETLADNPVQSFVCDEASGLLSKYHKRYNDGIFDLECKIYDCESVRKIKASGQKSKVKEFIVKNPYVTHLYATTPDKFCSVMTLEDFLCGYGYRWLYAFPTYQKDRMDIDLEDEENVEAWAEVLTAVKTLHKKYAEAKHFNFTITKDALKLFNIIGKELEDEAEKKQDESLDSAVARIEDNILKVAMLIEIGKKEPSHEITEESIAIASLLALDFFLPSFMQIMDRLLSDVKTNKIEKAMSVIRKMGGHCTRSTLIKNGHFTAKECDEIIEAMVIGHIVEEKRIKETKGTTYILVSDAKPLTLQSTEITDLFDGLRTIRTIRKLRTFAQDTESPAKFAKLDNKNILSNNACEIDFLSETEKPAKSVKSAKNAKFDNGQNEQDIIENLKYLPSLRKELITHKNSYYEKNGGIESIESLVEYLLKDCPGYLQLFPIEVIKAEAGKICKVA